jgi:hypothetical protein
MLTAAYYVPDLSTSHSGCIIDSPESLKLHECIVGYPSMPKLGCEYDSLMS